MGSVWEDAEEKDDERGEEREKGRERVYESECAVRERQIQKWVLYRECHEVRHPYRQGYLFSTRRTGDQDLPRCHRTSARSGLINVPPGSYNSLLGSAEKCISTLGRSLNNPGRSVQTRDLGSYCCQRSERERGREGESIDI